MENSRVREIKNDLIYFSLSIICGFISIYFFPPLFGVLGIVFGILVKDTYKIIAILMCIIFMLLGMYSGAKGIII